MHGTAPFHHTVVRGVLGCNSSCTCTSTLEDYIPYLGSYVHT